MCLTTVHSTSTSIVTDAKLKSLIGTRARVLVAVTVNTTLVGQPAQAPRNWRMMITVEKVGEAYKTAVVEIVP
jgi:Mce-associated membrane protein